MDQNISDLVKKGTQFSTEGDFEQALSYFDQAIILQPNNPDLLNKKGVALRGLGRYDEAIECFNKSLQL
ncbi:MAG TPA: tetratricopeptide repeat protein, partial [Candidatus Nitrosotalea sp.]|nr:tetratricopeptide repeat protein [Candidatus Nitrosotalea sp.]